LDRATIAGTVSPAIVVSFKSGDLEGFGTWVYKSTPRGAEAKKFESERRWGRFERAVHKLAA